MQRSTCGCDVGDEHESSPICCRSSPKRARSNPKTDARLRCPDQRVEDELHQGRMLGDGAVHESRGPLWRLEKKCRDALSPLENFG